MLNLIKRFFKKSTEPDNLDYTDESIIICHLVYDTKSQTASFLVDYDNLLSKYNSKDNVTQILSTSDSLSNFLYCLCNVKNFLPALILENLASNKKISDEHNLLISSTLSHLDELILAKDRLSKLTTNKPLVRPSQVFKNGQ